MRLATSAATNRLAPWVRGFASPSVIGGGFGGHLPVHRFHAGLMRRTWRVRAGGEAAAGVLCRLLGAAGTRCDAACGWRLVVFQRWQGGAEFAQQAGELALLCRGQSAEDVPFVG